MELYGQEGNTNGSQAEWATETGLQESMQSLNLWGREVYPERPGMPDCAYYMRTRVCGYGAKCRYNHPRNLDPAGEPVRSGVVEYPERIGEPSCQHFLRTGTCKFGGSCKFNHPRNANASFDIVPINVYGYPLRSGEKECSYYLKTGQCKFGVTCKFHHPQPAGTSLPASARPFYPARQTLLAPPPLPPQQQPPPPPPPSADQYGGASSTNYSVARPPLIPGSYVPGAYGPVLLHPGVLPIPNWTTYMRPVNGSQPVSVGPTASPRGMVHLSSSAPPISGTYNLPLLSYSGSEKHFPEKPGQPECQYYVKTGDCKFGSSCRFHHPPEILASRTNCALSPLGLPLRPGVQPCTYYLQKGVCKFGLACKFDHPMGTGTVNYIPSTSFTDVSVGSYKFNSSGTPLVPDHYYSRPGG